MAHTSRRPASTSTDNRSDAPARQLGIRLPAHMGEQLEAMARRENNGISAVVRRLLTAALADSNGAA
jgi:hypothetical protein